MFGLCVVTTISLVGMVWYNSFERNLYVLLNPEEATSQRFLAESQTIPASLLGNISQTGKDLKALFYNIFNLNNDDKKNDVTDEGTKVQDSGKVYTLPMSEKK
jgi:hypothetical protein